MASLLTNVSTIVNNNNNLNSDKKKPLFGKIVISLENSILSNDKLEVTPSMTDGLNREIEIDLRVLGCELIQTSGILLRLPQVAMATGQVLFQRYYYCKSLVRFQMEITAMACVTLASKIEEAPRRIRDVINVFHHIKQIRLEKEIKPLILDENYITTKNQVIKAERRLLKELGFCVHVKHPHKIIVTLLQVLDNEKNHQLMQTSWNYMNDSLRTNVFVRYSPEAIACACIYLSARVLKVPLPNNPNWFEIFNVSEDDIKDVCYSVLQLYVRPKPNQEQLERIVDTLRKDHENAKLKVKESAKENGTPSSLGHELSPGSRTNSPQVKAKSVQSPLKTALKSIPSTISHTNSPNKKRLNDSPLNKKRSRSKSLSISPINRNDNYDKNMRERERSPPKLYSNDYYSPSRSREPRDRGSRHHHHNKHKRIVYGSRSRSRSPAPHSHRHHNHNSKHIYSTSNSSNSRKSRKRSKSPYDRNTAYHSRSRRSRSRDLYVYKRS